MVLTPNMPCAFRVRQRVRLDDTAADTGLLHRCVVGVPVQQMLFERPGVERVIGSSDAVVVPDGFAVDRPSARSKRCGHS